MSEIFNVYEITCHDKKKKTFIVIDDDSDPYIQCPNCGVEQNLHDIKETDKSEGKCWRCKGIGRFPNDKECFTCDGTGILKYGHTRISLGLVTGEEIKALALRK